MNGAADVQQIPLVSVEAGRVSAGFRAAERELTISARLVGGLEPIRTGSPGPDALVEAGLRDLATMLERMAAAASGCVTALRRYDEATP